MNGGRICTLRDTEKLYEMASIEDLPIELIGSILLLIDNCSIVRFKSTCTYYFKRFMVGYSGNFLFGLGYDTHLHKPDDRWKRNAYITLYHTSN